MSSILTNTSAMVALQTMRGINSNLATTQNEISTGKSVSNARDNAAVWAVSKTMESDVRGFKSISDSLALGRSSVSVARNASETVTDLLTQMQGLIVSAQEENVDRTKIQNDVVALRDQIEAVTRSAQFNGLNLVNGSSNSVVSVLSSLDRGAEGIATNYISVTSENLTSSASVVDVDDGDHTAGTGTSAITLEFSGGGAGAINLGTVEAGVAYTLHLAFGTEHAGADNADGDAADIAYVASANDTAADVARGLASAFASWAAENNASDLEVSVNANGELAFASDTANVNNALNNVTVRVDTIESENNRAEGALRAMADIDVSTAEGAETALGQIDGLIQSAINAAASFGSVERRIDTQSEFVNKLSDALTTGIGSLVDADMEATSARLQALQVQQQLAIQSLSIANQQPQNILALFR
jgi:flagellin